MPASVFHLGSLATAIKVDAGIWAQVVEQLAARGVLISLDPNVRPSLHRGHGCVSGVDGSPVRADIDPEDFR